jgi:hypothetical protein
VHPLDILDPPLIENDKYLTPSRRIIFDNNAIKQQQHIIILKHTLFDKIMSEIHLLENKFFITSQVI